MWMQRGPLVDAEGPLVDAEGPLVDAEGPIGGCRGALWWMQRGLSMNVEKAPYMLHLLYCKLWKAYGGLRGMRE